MLAAAAGHARTADLQGKGDRPEQPLGHLIETSDEVAIAADGVVAVAHHVGAVANGGLLALDESSHRVVGDARPMRQG